MENEKQAPIFSEGLTFRLPSEKAPDFILLQMAVKSHKFFQWCQANQDEKGWVNLTVKRSKNGTVYADLDTWKPTPKPTVDDETGEKIPDNLISPDPTTGEVIDLENIPF